MRRNFLFILSAVRTIRLALIGLLIAYSFCACNKTEKEIISGSFFSKNFVQVYIIPDNIKLQEYKTDFILLEFGGKELHNSRESDNIAYDAYSLKYGDISYNRKLVPFSNRAIAEKIEVINVTCDKDLDKNHPAGSLLNDMIKLCATSPRRFIENNYTKETYQFSEEFKELGLNTVSGYQPVVKLLSELNEEDLVLLDNVCFLYITKKLPVGDYKFTIKTTVNNRELKEDVIYHAK